MPINKIRIHPAIGIARVGNSQEYFIGPLKPGEPAAPTGGFKDRSGNIKPQAAQFYLYAYDEAGRLMHEITSANARITWTAHLVNKKAEAENFPLDPPPPPPRRRRNPQVTNPADRVRLIIDPGPRSVTGPNQSARFDTGTFTLPGRAPVTVPLGGMATDSSGRLIMTGGRGTSRSPSGAGLSSAFNNPEWYDDVADGPISATVTIGAQTFTAEGAWVIVAPPKYAPAIPNAITLWDRLQNFFSPVPSGRPSYVKDIFPILESAMAVYGVRNVGSAHSSWRHPVTNPTVRQRIFARLTPPREFSWEGLTEDSDVEPITVEGMQRGMPPLAQATLTNRQYENMRKWKDGDFTNDWPPRMPPVITPEGLDQAALENCVGAAFFPGIEGGDFLIEDRNRYLQPRPPFRLDHNRVRAGDVTARMAIPWQADFYACGNDWWPPARPNQVIPQGTTPYQEWMRGIRDPLHLTQSWYRLGFVVKQADGAYREVDRGPVLAEAEEAAESKTAVASVSEPA